MSKVRIVQLLCPQRHCILATAYESADGAEIPEIAERVKEKFGSLVNDGVNPWCGICKSRDLHPEDKPTTFATMAEALPFLEELSRRQALTREYFKASRG